MLQLLDMSLKSAPLNPLKRIAFIPIRNYAGGQTKSSTKKKHQENGGLKTYLSQQ
jgi:hypothetical protein